MNTQALYDIEQQPTILFDENEIPLTKGEWRDLLALLVSSEYEHIIGGDANESHSVWVSRYFNDVVSPEALNSLSSHIENIVMSTKMRAFYRRFTGTKKLCLRRCQASNGNPVRRAGNIVQAHLMTKYHRFGIATVFAANA